LHETSSLTAFSWGIANRGASVRVPRTTGRDGKGYYEDRRPASDVDPYLVTSCLFDCAILGGSSKLDEMIASVTQNAPYLLLTSKKIEHWQQFNNESI